MSGGEEFHFHSKLTHFLQRHEKQFQEVFITVGEVNGVQMKIGMNTSVQRRKRENNISVQVIKSATRWHDAKPTGKYSWWIREGVHVYIEGKGVVLGNLVDQEIMICIVKYGTN